MRCEPIIFKEWPQGGHMTQDTDGDDRDLEQALEDYIQRIFNPRTERVRKKAEKALAEHTARPGLTDDIEKLVRDFEVRLKGLASLPPGTPPEYREAFSSFLEQVISIPSLEQHEVLDIKLMTQHLVYFQFIYGIEPLCALLGLKAFNSLSPSPSIFNQKTLDTDEAEQARKTQELVELVARDVNACVSHACELFEDALRGRLASVIVEVTNEVITRSINDLLPKLNNVGEKDIADLRKNTLKLWTGVEKARLDTPSQGPRTFRHREELEALIDEAQERLKSAGVDQNKTSFVGYINTHHPQVRCGSVKQLNRLLKNFGLEHKFPKEKEKREGQI
jgi:hypothetical protein